MSEYISLEAAENAFCKYMGFTSGRVALASELIFAKIPAADVVEVVRCYECKRWTGQPDREYGHCSRFGAICLNSDYCSRGVRKAGQENG